MLEQISSEKLKQVFQKMTLGTQQLLLTWLVIMLVIALDSVLIYSSQFQLKYYLL
jgi:hypothetical protein